MDTWENECKATLLGSKDKPQLLRTNRGAYHTTNIPLPFGISVLTSHSRPDFTCLLMNWSSLGSNQLFFPIHSDLSPTSESRNHLTSFLLSLHIISVAEYLYYTLKISQIFFTPLHLYPSMLTNSNLPSLSLILEQIYQILLCSSCCIASQSPYSRKR